MMENKDETLYKKNIDTIARCNPFLWKDVTEDIEYKEEVYVDQSLKGESIVAVVRDGATWYLNSRYDATLAAEAWAEQLGDLKYVAIIFVFGIGNGVYLQQLRKKYPDNMIVAYEPSREIFDTVLKEIDMTDVLDDEHIVMAVGEKGHKLFVEYVCSCMNYANFSHAKWVIAPNYQQLFGIEYLKIQNMYMNWIRQITLDRNTYLIAQNEFAENTLQNTWDALTACSIDDLAVKIREKIDVERYPAIIVSAGPSLDKNIEELKTAKKKAFIIVVDTALKATVRAGIKPDMTITIDPHKPLILFEDERIKELPMVVCILSNTKVLEKHEGKKIYFGEDESYFESVCEMYGKKMSRLETGGSVANNAFSLACFLGFKKIILIGQDLAYPGKKEHTKDAYDNEQENEIDFSKKKYVEVEDIFGNKVWTEGNMDAYRKWFEMQIIRYPQLKVIDATEGGARIKGTEILTLKEAIRRECEDLEEVDFEQIISELEPYFSKEELVEVSQQLRDIPKELDVIREKLHEGIARYEDLKKAAKAKKISKSKVKQILEDVTITSEWLENKAEMCLVQMYNYEADYNMKGKVFNIQEDLKAELTTIAENGIEMYESYFSAMETLEKNLDILYQRM